jgi:hypothetical protein
MKTITLHFCTLLLALAACQQLASTAAAVTFSVTPSAVSNFYAGTITLQIGGLDPGETVQVDKFLDANRNGVIDGADLPVQSFRLTDGQASVFYDGVTAVTNFNVPGDVSTATGAITAQVRIASDIAQAIVGQYLVRVSSPTNRFTPITNVFNVTNSAYAQLFTGTVRSGGSIVPNAVIMVAPSSAGKGNPFAGVMADTSGNYTLNLPAGTYSFWLFKSNYVADLSQSPTVTLANGATVTANLSFLIPATTSISGYLLDAGNTNKGVRDIFMVCQSSDEQYMAGACFTGTNGAFSVPVTAGQWGVSMDGQGLGTYNYMSPNDGPQVDTSTGSVSGLTMALPKATAIFYGRVLDGQGQPLAGIDVSSWDDNNYYWQDAFTDANGYYIVPVVGGSSDDRWEVKVSSDSAPAGLLFSQPAFNQNGGTNLYNGQALQVNFNAVAAANHISGWLKDSSGNPIGNVWIWAQATIGGTSYDVGTDTAADGTYSINVANGTWTVGVNTGGDGDGLPSNYFSPADQTVVIANNNGTANFTALAATSHISGYVTNAVTGQGIANIGVPAWATINGVQYMQYARTDGNGYYSISVINGSWSVYVNCGDCSDCLPSSLYECPSEQTVIIANNNPVMNFAVQPIGPLQITTTTLPPGAVGEYYNESLEASGGQPSYNWWLPGGTMSLPPGQSGDMSFSGDGTISGIPSTPGTYTFWAGVFDSAAPPNMVTQLVSLTINQPVADVVTYFVMKMEAFRQVDAANFVLDTNFGPFNAYLGLVQSSVGSVTIANVTLPGGAARALPSGSSGIELETEESFRDQASIDTLYPPGNYTFSLLAVDDGLRYPVLSMPSAPYPSHPQVSNFAAAQAINPSSPFTLQWSAIPGATTDDSIWVYATDAGGNVVFSTPKPSTDRLAALNGTATAVLIPTNTFQPGHAYTGWIMFLHTTSLNTTAYPGAAGVTLVAATTSFPLALATSSPPMLSRPARISSTQFGFLLSGVPGQNYTVLVSTNTARPLTDWSTLLITNLSASPALIQDNQANGNQRFYRVKVGP